MFVGVCVGGECDDRKLGRRPEAVQYSVHSAGMSSNLISRKESLKSAAES